MQNVFLCATLSSSGLAYSISPVQQRQTWATAQIHKHKDDDLAKLTVVRGPATVSVAFSMAFTLNSAISVLSTTLIVLYLSRPQLCDFSYPRNMPINKPEGWDSPDTSRPSVAHFPANRSWRHTREDVCGD